MTTVLVSQFMKNLFGFCGLNRQQIRSCMHGVVKDSEITLNTFYAAVEFKWNTRQVGCIVQFSMNMSMI